MAKKKQISTIATNTWQDALQNFIYWKQAMGLADVTISDYRYHVTQFFTRHPEAFTQQSLKRSVLKYMSQKVKPATYNLRLVYLRTFFNWCIEEGILPENPLAGFKKRKDEGRIVKLDAETITKLISLPDKKTYAGLRDYTLVLLTMDTGIRPKEAFYLLVDDVNFRSLEVHIRAEVAKTRVSRTLPLSPPTSQSIRDLLKARHPDWKDDVPIFATTDGTLLNSNTWGDRIEAYCKQLGVKFRPYDLRHAFALQYLRNGGHALGLQRIMGHSDLTMTKRYVALTQQDVRDQHSLASPLNTFLPQKKRVRKVKN
ncbi:MAG: site-specific integrase [Firmicutes bacterium]|nr:site-specific integrase [Bacillota bacterium]